MVLPIGGLGTGFTYRGPWNWFYLSRALELANLAGANERFYLLGVLELVLPIGGSGTGFTYWGS